MSNRILTPLLPFAVILASFADAQITVTQPSGNTVFAAADDYATQAFQDPWNMQKWTDLGWYTYGSDAPASNLTGFSFAGGMFSATSTSNNPNFWLLDTFTPGTVALGKIGSLYPINSTKYQRLLIRMNLSGSGFSNPPTSGQQTAQILWSNNTIFQSGGMSTAGSMWVYPGWWVYSVNVPSLGLAAGPTAWPAQPVDSLRFDPVNLPAPININVGWARLVEDDPSLYATITWTGSGPVDIYLDNDTNFSNGYVGQIATDVSGNSYQFYVGGLPAGTYYVAIRPFGSSATPTYSPGSWTVNDIPTLVFTAPSPQGSNDDFATTQMNAPWNSSSVNEIEYSVNVTGLNIATINAQDEPGNPLPNTRVLAGTTTSNYVDPELYTLYWGTGGLGQTYNIDTSRYRILSLKWGSPVTRSLNNGSCGRLVWKLTSEGVENVSNCIATNTLPNVNVMQDVIADMTTVTLAPNGGSPSTSGWTSLLDGFRLKTDEWPNAISFYIESVRLTAFEQANASYAIQWNYANQGGTVPTLELDWDNTGSGYSGTLIASGLDPTTGSYVWNTSGLANGNYYVYARLLNGSTVMNESYAKWPVVVNHSLTASLALNASPSGAGTVTANPSAAGGVYAEGTEVCLTATPNTGWVFSSWSGATLDGSNCLILTANTTVTANFQSAPSYTLILDVSPSEAGTLTANPSGGTYVSGTQVCLIETPNAGWEFSSWSGATVNSSNCLTITANTTVTANYVTATALRFVPVTPCRVVDTRYANGAFGSPELAAGSTRDFVIPSGSCNIPATAAAYSLNVTVVPNGALGWLTVWPSGQTQPHVSTLNSADGRIKANAAIVPAGAGGAVSVYVTDATNVILDIDGYFVPAASNATALAFYPLPPCRVADTRYASFGALLGPPSLSAGQPRGFPILSSSCNVPASAAAYSLNFTAVPPAPFLYITTYPTGQTRPLASTLNDPTGTIVANAAIVPAGTGGSVNVYSSGATDVVIDINGYFAPPGAGGLSLYNLTPCRALDTRLPAGSPPFSGEQDVNVSGSGCGAPAAAQAYVFNATVVPPGPMLYLTLWPQGGAKPVVSTLNALDGAITSNMAIVPTSNGIIAAAPSALTYLILDIFGYFAP
jgi:hypothetical protein